MATQDGSTVVTSLRKDKKLLLGCHLIRENLAERDLIRIATGPITRIEDESPFGCFETSFRRFRRTILEGSRFLPARHILLGAFSGASGDTKLYHPRWRRGECWMRDALLGTQHNGLTCKSRQWPTPSWQYHETEEDRDAQDRVGRPSAVTARRPA